MERDQASKFVNDLLRLMVSRSGSDLFLTAGFPPAIKLNGLIYTEGDAMNRSTLRTLAASERLCRQIAQVRTTLVTNK